MSHRIRRVSALLGLIAMAPAVVGCGGAASAGYETPEACFAAMKTAAKNKDAAGLCNCMTDESQSAIAGVLVMAGSMMKMMSGMAAMGGPEAAAEAEKSLGAISAILEKHGVTEDALKDMAPTGQEMGDSAALVKLASIVKDKKAFIADMFDAMQKTEQGGKFTDKFDEKAAGELKDVTIERDRASAVLATPSGEEPIEFRKEGGGWKLQLDLDAMGPSADESAPPG